jgi:hypothetical protein
MKANRNFLLGEISYNTILCYLVSLWGGKILSCFVKFFRADNVLKKELKNYYCYMRRSRNTSKPSAKKHPLPFEGNDYFSFDKKRSSFSKFLHKYCYTRKTIFWLWFFNVIASLSLMILLLLNRP